MQINITGHHIDLSTVLQEYIHNKMQRLERHCSEIMQLHVIIEPEKGGVKAEATGALKGERFFAEAVQRDAYAAVNILVDKLDSHVTKHKDRLTDHHSR